MDPGTVLKVGGRVVGVLSTTVVGASVTSSGVSKVSPRASEGRTELLSHMFGLIGMNNLQKPRSLLIKIQIIYSVKW